MGIIAKYKFNQNTYADFIPTFNTDFTDYTITDEIDTDSYTIRTISNDSGNSPTQMKFGANSTTNREKSLLELFECNTSQLTGMNDMFRSCLNLTSLNLSSFNTEKVTGMSNMFRGCSSLKSLDLSSFNTEKVTGMSNMFRGCSNLTSLNLSGFNTEKVTSMDYMFYGCSNLTSLDLSSFNTQNVSSMSNMFRGCLGLTSLNLSSFKTQNVTGMREMFYNCSGLTSLNLSSFNTEKVDDMRDMFYNCSGLTSLNLSSFNTEKVDDMQNMFYNCSGLTSLNLSSFNTQNVTNMSYMFGNCRNLASLDLTNFDTQNVTSTTSMFGAWSSSQKVYISSKWTLGTDFPPTFIITFANIIAKYKFNQSTYESFIPEFNTDFTDYTYNDETDTDGFTIRTIGNGSGNLPTLIRFGSSDTSGNGDYTKQYSLLEINNLNTNNVTNMNLMFYQCKNLTHINANFNTNNVANMSAMFYGCSSLISLNVSNFNTSQVTDMSYMFYSCTSLTSLDVSNFNTEKVTTMLNMFNECSSLTSLDVSNFNTSNATTMYAMFYNCSSLTSLDVSNFDTEKVTSIQDMFNNCKLLTSLDVSNFNTEKVTSMQGVFGGCQSLTSLNVSNFNTEKVTNMSWMFHGCSKLISLDLSNFNTKNVTTMYAIFNNCQSLALLDISNFDTSNATTMQAMFQNCSSLISLDVSNFNTNKVADMQNMFNGCKSLTSLDVSNFNTSNVVQMQFMFQDCSSLTSLDLSSFNTSKVTNMNSTLRNCDKLTLLDISNWRINANVDTTNLFTKSEQLENIGAIYCDASTINKISDLITTNTSIYYMNARLDDLTKKENITYKEYKMNILESDEEINLRRIGDIYDELNLETGELTERIGEIVLNGSENWEIENPLSNDEYIYFKLNDANTIKTNIPTTMVVNVLTDKLKISSYIKENSTKSNSYFQAWTSHFIGISRTELSTQDVVGFKEWLSNNNIPIQYPLSENSVKTINLKNKPSINWQGDTYLHLENNTLYPQLDCEVESINYYEIPKLKANTLYTLRYVGEPTQCIFGGLTYEAENNMILTSGSSDNLLYFDKEVRKVVLIEGDVRDRNFDYFEGIESLGAVEIITRKTDIPIFAKGGRK